MSERALGTAPPVALRALGSVRHFLQDQPLYREGEPASHFMQLVGGVVRSLTLRRDGRRYIEAFHIGGDMFGLESSACHASSAEAVCPCSAILFPAQDHILLNAGRDGPSPLAFAAMEAALQHARRHAQLLSRANAREKIASFLLECNGRAGQRPLLALAMTRQDIGDYLGLSVETISRSLAQLHRERVIEILSARSVKLLNMAALREMIS